MSTIKDVAKLAGVSISTVSYTLNDTGNVSEKTKQKVLKAVTELNYQPNGIARSLKMKKNYLIAVVVNEFSGPIYAEIIRGINAIAKINDYEVIIAESFSGHSVTKLLSQRLVDGAIILAANIEDSVVKSIAGEKFPIVMLDRNIICENVSNVLIDNETSAYQVVNYVAQKGYKTMGFMRGPKNTYDSNKRYDGFKRGVFDFKIEHNSKWCLVGDFTEDGGYMVMKKFLKEKNLPDVFFIANDEMAIGAIRALKENGINVPKDMGIIGFDDIALCEYITPALTTVHRPSYELGVVAANNLITTLNGKTTSTQTILTSQIVVRESC